MLRRIKKYDDENSELQMRMKCCSNLPKRKRGRERARDSDSDRDREWQRHILYTDGMIPVSYLMYSTVRVLVVLYYDTVQYGFCAIIYHTVCTVKYVRIILLYCISIWTVVWYRYHSYRTYRTCSIIQPGYPGGTVRCTVALRTLLVHDIHYGSTTDCNIY